jgi:hypothetical protein
MSRRRRLLFLSFTAVVIGVAVGVWLLWPHTAITRDNFAQLRVGMSRSEVEAVLGGPARDESSGPIVVDWSAGWSGPECDRMTDGERVNLHFESFRDLRYNDRPEEWASDTLVIQLTFRRTGRFLYGSCYPAQRNREPLVQQVRRWLGR